MSFLIIPGIASGIAALFGLHNLHALARKRLSATDSEGLALAHSLHHVEMDKGFRMEVLKRKS